MLIDCTHSNNESSVGLQNKAPKLACSVAFPRQKKGLSKFTSIDSDRGPIIRINGGKFTRIIVLSLVK